MGVGKSSIGRRLASRLGLPFHDSDDVVEDAARMKIADIFATLGEPAFREGEARVIRRLLEGPAHVLATGGGAILNPDTRALLKERAVTVWLKTDLETIARRTARRDTRPLLRGRNPLEVLTELAEKRYPLYAEADIVVETGDGAHVETVEAILAALERRPAGADHS